MQLMRYSLFKSAQATYFLLALTLPHPENALVRAYRVTDLEWADLQPVGTELSLDEGQLVNIGIYDLALSYLRLDAWPKYYFPTFGTAGPGQDYAYQWYELADAQELLDLVKECLHVASVVGGVTVGSR